MDNTCEAWCSVDLPGLKVLCLVMPAGKSMKSSCADMLTTGAADAGNAAKESVRHSLGVSEGTHNGMPTRLQ